MKRVALGFLRTYKRHVSPFFPAACRFTPSCSQYAVDAIERYGLIVGLVKAGGRVLRCHPFSKGGADPVK